MSFVAYLSRSFQHLKQQAKNAFVFQPPHPTEQLLFSFKNAEECKRFLVGSDADIGGYSEAYWGLTPEKTGLFWGTISTKVPQKLGIEKSGYAGIKSKLLPMVLMHRPMIDTSLFRYLEIRARGDDKNYMVNIQTEGLYPTIIWQHKLFFQTPGEWETVRIPFRDFVRTSHGYVQKKQITMDRTKIKSMGFSILSQPGEFSLELDYIKAINEKNTLGDYDIIDKHEFIDENGRLLLMDETLDIRLAALRRKLERRVEDGFGNLQSVVLLQTIALQNIQLQNAIANLSIPKQDDKPSYRRPRKYEYIPKKNTYTKQTRIELTKYNPRKKWKLLSNLVYFTFKISKKFRNLVRASKQTAQLIEDGLSSLTELFSSTTHFKQYKDTVKVLSNEGCDVLVRDGIGFLFTKKPNKSQTIRFCNAVKGLLDMILEVPFDDYPTTTKELFQRASNGGPLLVDFLWDNEKNADPKLILGYLVVVKVIISRLVLAQGSDLEKRAFRATALILYRILRQACSDEILVVLFDKDMEPAFFRLIQGYCGSKEEAEIWNETNSKSVYRICEVWMQKGIDQMDEFFGSILSPKEPEIPDTKEVAIQEASDVKEVNKEGLLNKQEPYVPSFVQERRESSTTNVIRRGSLPVVANPGKTPNVALPPAAKEMDFETKVRRSIPTLAGVKSDSLVKLQTGLGSKPNLAEANQVNGTAPSPN